MWFHLINDKKNDKRDRSLFHGRAFWHFENNNEIYAEWVLGSKAFSLGFTVSKGYVSEHTMSFSFCIPPFAFYWGFTWKWLEDRKWWGKLVGEDMSVVKHVLSDGTKIHQLADERVFGLRIFDWAIWWDIYSKSGEWNSSDPKWMSGGFHPLDFLFGRYDYETQVIEKRNVKVPMPEKEYDGYATLEKATWRRKKFPIWPFYKSSIRVNIDMDEPIPHPGKGTCSYNCGEDALHSLTCNANTIEDGIGEVIKSVIKCRLTYPL